MSDMPEKIWVPVGDDRFGTPADCVYTTFVKGATAYVRADLHDAAKAAIRSLLESEEWLEARIAELEEDAEITTRRIIEQVAPVAIEPTEDGYGRCRFCGVRGDGDGLTHAVVCVLFTHYSEHPPTPQEGA